MLNLKKPLMIKAIALTTLLFSQASAFAQSLTPQQIIDNVVSKGENTGYKAKKSLTVTRRRSNDSKDTATIDTKATARITFGNLNNYHVEIIESEQNAISKIVFYMKDGKNTVYLPDERLFLFNGGPNTSYMPERIILSTFTPRADLILKNYNVKPVTIEQIGYNQAYVLDFSPKNSFKIKETDKESYWVAPRRKYWIDTKTFHVLKEERYWDESSNPFARTEIESSSYETLNSAPALPEIKLQGEPNRVNLSGDGDQKQAFRTYATIADAEKKEGIKINPPEKLPPGFVFKEVQVFTLFGARIQVLYYTDGLNDMMITIRPAQNAFVTLLAGAASLNLIKKVTDLAHQAPNNYMPFNSPNRIAVVFGDVAPWWLERAGKSMASL